jgi:hypothetical protein
MKHDRPSPGEVPGRLHVLDIPSKALHPRLALVEKEEKAE